MRSPDEPSVSICNLLVSTLPSLHMFPKSPLQYSTYRFLAAPNPPGKKTASAAPTVSSDSGFTAPRAMRADSTMILRVSPSAGAPWNTSSPLSTCVLMTNTRWKVRVKWRDEHMNTDSNSMDKEERTRTAHRHVNIQLRYVWRTPEEYVRSIFLCGSETRTLPKKLKDLLAAWRMMSYRTVITWRDCVSSEKVKRHGLKKLTVVLRVRRLKWFRHTERKGSTEALGKAVRVEELGHHPLGRPRKKWWQCAEEGPEPVGNEGAEAMDRDSGSV